jgi:hypothetical protein
MVKLSLSALVPKIPVSLVLYTGAKSFRPSKHIAYPRVCACKLKMAVKKTNKKV